MPNIQKQTVAVKAVKQFVCRKGTEPCPTMDGDLLLQHARILQNEFPHYLIIQDFFVLFLIHCAQKEKYEENPLLPFILGNNKPFQAKKPLVLQTAEVEITFLNELFGDKI